MKLSNLINLFLLIGLLPTLACAADSSGGLSSDMINGFPEPIYTAWEGWALEGHNEMRKAFAHDRNRRYWPGGVKPDLPPLTWSPKLAQQAAKWTAGCPNDGDPAPTPPAGIGQLSQGADRHYSDYQDPWTGADALISDAELKKTAAKLHGNQPEMAKPVSQDEFEQILWEARHEKRMQLVRRLPRLGVFHAVTGEVLPDKESRDVGEVGCAITRCLSNPADDIYDNSDELKFDIRIPIACFYAAAVDDKTQTP